MEILTYEDLLEEVLKDVRDDVDKREGSIMYDAIAPITYYLAEQRELIGELRDEAFIDTAKGSFLDRLCLGYGIERKEETKSKRLIRGTKELEIGTRLGINDIFYEVKEKLNNGSEYDYMAECSEYGSVGNVYKGTIESEDKTVSATLLDIIEVGLDEEDDETLRKRLFLRIQKPATSGNIYHYRNWALEVNGVKEAKIFPLENGAGTVGVMIYSDEKDGELVDRVRKHIDLKRPIGATVNVYMPVEKNIDISVNISLLRNVDSTKVKEDIEKNLKAYLRGLIFNSKKVSYAKISSIILEMQGVEDFENLLVNGTSSNVVIGDKEVAKLGKLDLRF